MQRQLQPLEEAGIQLTRSDGVELQIVHGLVQSEGLHADVYEPLQAKRAPRTALTPRAGL